MPLRPDQPFPKTRGNPIRAKDWNDAVTEVIRLDGAKLNQTGGTVGGNLAVTGNLSGGTITGNLGANTVGSGQLATGAVSTDKIATGAVTASKLAPASVGLTQLNGFLLFDFGFTTSEELPSQNIVVVFDEDIEGDIRGYQLFVFAYSFTVNAEFTFTVKYNYLNFRTQQTVVVNHGFRVLQARCRIFGLRGF
jgi:hypothetical protein